MEDMQVYDVFLSYRRSDGKDLTEALYAYLTARGLRVFFDKTGIVAGSYFSSQLYDQVIATPNYVLVATEDAFRFREGEDWVREEIETALKVYDQAAAERTVTVLVPENVVIPEKSALPEKVRKLAEVQRVLMEGNEKAFEEVLTAVTRINRRNLWQAAHRWLENSKRPGGRFASLSISESLLPGAAPVRSGGLLPIHVRGEKTEPKPLLETIAESREHLYLIGQGGIGKTTALMHIMNQAYDSAYDSGSPTPIFVELSCAPDTYGALYEAGRSSYIRRAVYKQVRANRTLKQISAAQVSQIDEVFCLPREVAVGPIDRLFSKERKEPEYLLLLDGLNEVSPVILEQTGLSVAQMVMQEIALLVENCPNVRVILTGRSDSGVIPNGAIRRLWLSGLDDGAVEAYLRSAEIPDSQLQMVLKKPALMDTLKIPLFLTIFAALSNHSTVASRGQILHLFFHERRSNLALYTVQDRLDRVEKDVTQAASATQRNRIDGDMQSFILDFVLPRIAWSMERSGVFYLSIRQLRKLVEPVVRDTGDTAVCGEFGREIFGKYRVAGSVGMHTAKVAKKLCARLEGEDGDLTEGILNCCVFCLGVLQGMDGKYGFIHQHIRDYFAAVHNVNTLRLSVYIQEEGEQETALACMNEYFHAAPVGLTVGRFMGEILGETENTLLCREGLYYYGVPGDPCDRNLLDRALNIYRGKFQWEGGYALRSLLGIASGAREALAGMDLSRLDLSGCHLNGVKLGLPGLAASLTGSKVNGEDLFMTGHSARINDVSFSPGGKYLVSGSNDTKVKLWDNRSGELLQTWQQSGGVTLVRFLTEESVLVIARAPDYRGTLSLWNVTTGQKELERQVSYVPEHADISGDRALLYDSFAMVMWSLETGEILLDLGADENERLSNVSFFGENLLLTTNRYNFNSTNELWKADGSGKLPPPEGIVGGVEGSGTNSDGTVCLICKENYTYERTLCILDPHSGKLLRSITPPKLDGSDTCTERVVYSHSGKLMAVLLRENVLLYETVDYSLIRVFTDKRYQALCFTPGDDALVLGTLDGEIITFELREFSVIQRIIGSWNSVTACDCSRDGSLLATISQDGYVRVWTAEGLLLGERRSYRSPVCFVHFSRDNQRLMVNIGGCFSLLRLPDLKVIMEQECYGMISSDGKYLIGRCSGENFVRRTEDLSLVGYYGELLVEDVFEDGIVAHSSTDDELGNSCTTALHALDRDSGKILRTFAPSLGRHVEHSAVNRDFVVLCDSGGKLLVFDRKTGKKLKTICSGEKVSDVAFSPDGKYLLAVEREETILRDTKDFQVAAKLDGRLEYADNGNFLCGHFGENDLFMVYDAHSFQLLYSLPMGFNMIFKKFGISAAGKRLVVIRGGRAEVYDMEQELEQTTTIRICTGLEVVGLDLRKLHPDSRFTEEQKEDLRLYGAIL